MAWFWNSGNDEDDEESYYDDEDEEEDHESELSEEDFAEEDEEEEESNEGTDNNDHPNSTSVGEEEAMTNEQHEGGNQRPESMNPEEDDDESDNDLLEEEFAQLVNGDPSSSSAVAAETKQKEQETSHDELNGSISSSTNGQKAVVPQETNSCNDTTDHPNTGTNQQSSHEKDGEEEEEQVTTLEEKQSLLVLAAEHDRVDILQAILAEPETKQQLLDGDSLHIAISHGSVNAVNCLLRMGADPSIQKDGKTAWDIAFDNSKSIAPSKREGIRHAFTAEALRCIGADEVERLQQLVAAGLPHTCDIGGRSLAEWTVDLGATRCQEMVGIQEDKKGQHHATVVNRFHEEDLPALENRLDELNNLSKALSEFLDNLAEEVSVCSGLLLVGSGAAALAAHVKSLKQQTRTLADDLERHTEVWENSEDELAYWIRECGGVDILKTLSSGKDQQQPSGSPTEEHDEKQRLKAQIAACETKIRMLRASIADLSDENERNLVEVERRGVQGGVRLVRSLRDEIVDLEFRLSEANSGEAACRARISLLQHHAKSNSTMTQTAAAEPTGENHVEEKVEEKKTCEEVEAVTSTAIIVRPSGGSQGFLPFTIWQMFLRIMGLSNAPSSSNRQAMIV